MSTDDVVKSLIPLGFTELEAEVYTFLLQESPVTGYRVAQVTGRLPANVYKAIESLENKGAIIVDQGQSRMCRAVPAEELLSMLRRKYKDREAAAERALSSIRTSTEDDRIYQLRTKDQVLERARTMIGKAQKVVLADLFPVILDELEEDFSKAGKRGMHVTIKAYRPKEVKNALVVLNPGGESLTEKYIGQFLVLLVDGMDLLIASFTPDFTKVVQAVWTSSPTVSFMLHSSLSSEMMLCAILDGMREGAEWKELVEVAGRFVDTPKDPKGTNGALVQEMNRLHELFGHDVPGRLEILKRLGAVDGHQDSSEANNA